MRTNHSMVCLLDHDLKTVRDSVMSHSLTFAQAFLESSTQTEIWAHRSCDLQHPAVRRVFQISQGTLNHLAGRGKWPALRKINHFVTVVRANVSYFLSLCRARPTEDAILFAVNSSPFVVPALQLFGRFNSQVRIAIYFQRPATRLVKVIGINHRALRLTNLLYCTEVPAIARKYESALGLPCHVVPCPLPRAVKHAVNVAEGTPLGLLLGQPRQQKGFDLFVEALDHFMGPLQGRLRVAVQSLPMDQVEPSLRQSAARLSILAKKYPQLEVISHPLTRTEYHNRLSRCDFVILPYRRESYSHQSSGIAFEALTYGKPLIATEGLSFVPVAAAYNAVVQVPDGDAVALAEGIARLVSQLANYQARAARAAEDLERVHSIDHLSAYLHHLFRGRRNNSIEI